MIQTLLPSKASKVSPLTALSTLQVVEARVTSATVPARHMRQTLALPSHGVTAALLLHGPVGIAGAGCGGRQRKQQCKSPGRTEHTSLGLCCQVQKPPVTYSVSGQSGQMYHQLKHTLALLMSGGKRIPISLTVFN